MTSSLVKGEGWQAKRDGKNFILEFLAARHGGGVDRYDITSDEFEALKLGQLSFEELLRKYDVG